jgi:hypothetical protein
MATFARQTGARADKPVFTGLQWLSPAPGSTGGAAAWQAPWQSPIPQHLRAL